MPFCTRSLLRVTAVSRLMIRASGCIRASCSNAAPPDVGWFVSPRNKPIRLFGKQNVILGRAHVIFVDLWAAGVCQYLVDTAATHDIAAQEKPQRFAMCGQVSVLMHEIAPQLVCVNAAITSASKRCSSPA